MDPTSHETKVILQAVRGERSLSNIELIGIRYSVSCSPVGYSLKLSDPRDFSVQVSPGDIAVGLLAHLHDPAQLREWAFLLLAFDFVAWDSGGAEGEIGLDALWDASFGKPLTDDQLSVLKLLAGGA